MRITEDVHQPLDRTTDRNRDDELPADARSDQAKPRMTARRWWALGIVSILVTGGSTAAVLESHRSAVTPAGAPITLPATISGLPALADDRDLTQTPAWRLKARTAGHGSTVVGRVYGTIPGARTIRIVAGRTDLTGELDQAIAATAGEAVGAVHCTNDTIIVKNSQPRIRPTVMLCWRTSATLSVTSLIIDARATSAVTQADGAAAVDAAWQAAEQTP